jgi:hypothetical protein
MVLCLAHKLCEFKRAAEKLAKSKGVASACNPGGGAITGGATHEEALAEAADCLASWLVQALADSALDRTESALYNAKREQGISKTEPARRLGVRETVVLRMLDPDHATKSMKIEQSCSTARSITRRRFYGPDDGRCSRHDSVARRSGQGHGEG